MKRDDTLWKSILEDIFEDFLIFFYPDAGSFFVQCTIRFENRHTEE